MESKYTAEDSERIYNGDHEDFDDVHLAEYCDGDGRWHDYRTRVFRHKDGSLWGVDAARGKTEMQEDEFSDPPYRVEAREETIPARVVTAYWRGDQKLGD